MRRIQRLLLRVAIVVVGLISRIIPIFAQTAPDPPVPGRILRFDSRLDWLLPKEAVVETVVAGRTWVEGPVWDRKTGSLLFSDVPANVVLRWSEAEGVTVALERSGYTGAAPFPGREPGSNGLGFTPDGRLSLSEHGDRRVTRLEPDGRKTVLADRYLGKRLNSPNDHVWTEAGDLLFTDPPFGLPGTYEDPGKELP